MACVSLVGHLCVPCFCHSRCKQSLHEFRVSVWLPAGCPGPVDVHPSVGFHTCTVASVSALLFPTASVKVCVTACDHQCPCVPWCVRLQDMGAPCVPVPVCALHLPALGASSKQTHCPLVLRRIQSPRWPDGEQQDPQARICLGPHLPCPTSASGERDGWGEGTPWAVGGGAQVAEEGCSELEACGCSLEWSPEAAQNRVGNGVNSSLDQPHEAST